MKKHLHYIALLLFLFIPTFVWSDTVPIQGDWTQGDLRSAGSIPFIVEKENNTLHILSRKHVENVLINETLLPDYYNIADIIESNLIPL